VCVCVGIPESKRACAQKLPLVPVCACVSVCAARFLCVCVKPVFIPVAVCSVWVFSPPSNSSLPPAGVPPLNLTLTRGAPGQEPRARDGAHAVSDARSQCAGQGLGRARNVFLNGGDSGMAK